MDIQLSLLETRVLGCLLEKEMTTPDYYPLTLNSLLAACNQKTNRDPVVDFDEETVARGIEELREKRFVMRVDVAGSRVPKYKHSATSVFALQRRELAVLTVLLLRGPQTLGELRQRTERMHHFENLEEIETALNELATIETEPLVVALPMQPGKKERRYAHLLSGQPETVEHTPARPLEDATNAIREEKSRIAQCETEVESLKTEIAALQEELASLKTEFAGFRKQFE